MISDLKKQLNGIDKESGIVLISALLLMCLFPYQGSSDFYVKKIGDQFNGDANFLSQTYRFFFTFLIFFAVPALITKFVLKKNIRDYGFALGDKAFGFKIVLISFIALPLPLYLNAGSPDFLHEYPLWKHVGDSFSNIVLWSFLYLFYYIGWEFLFRGYMQFSLKDKIPGFYIIMIQTIASTIIHIGKPQGEMISAVFAGIVFGALALRTRSILYPLLIHWYLGMLNELFCYIKLH